MLHAICTFILLFIVISMIWPDPRKKQTEADRKHKELLDAVRQVERQNAASVPPPRPAFGSAERARILALGRMRDGARRHPILDTPFVSVANPSKGKFG
jgi:hypothetical protein